MRPSRDAVRLRREPSFYPETIPLRRKVAFLLGGVLIGTIGYKLVTPATPHTDFSAMALPARNERPCGPISGKTAIIVVHGQSNAANFGSARHSAREVVDNFDPATGKCFAAVDPLLGTDGIGGSFATRLGDILIQAGRYDRVILVPLARGGASLAFLNNEGAELITNGIAKLKAAGLTPTHILFQQGETDAVSTTTAEEYASLLRQLVKRFRAAGLDAPFYLSRSAKCDYVGPSNIAAVRAGQRSAVDEALNIRPGPDTDTIGNEGRSPDGCHMNEAGTLANAALWAAFIK
jgi:carbohydrate esterase-like sialic acid-specific acetylesterase